MKMIIMFIYKSVSAIKRVQSLLWTALSYTYTLYRHQPWCHIIIDFV